MFIGDLNAKPSEDTMDLFISYRRDTGGGLAALINEKFTQKGVETFFDRENIHNVDFWKRIQRGIDQSSNFLMILSPGYFAHKDGEVDYAQSELLYAIEKKKNILAIATRNYNPDNEDWEDLPEEIKKLKTFDYKVYPIDGNQEMIDAFLRVYIRSMVNRDGTRFSLEKKLYSNSWYSEHGMSEEDFLWIKTDHTVCRSLDWDILGRALSEEGLFEGRDELNLLCYKAYDIDTYRKKYDLDPKKDYAKKIKNVYGITYEGLLERANEVFGEGHFVSDDIEGSDYASGIEDLLETSGLDGFDIIDMTLVIKDFPHPEKIIRDSVKYLNPEGGIIYIRELDDDYIDCFPDDNGYVKRLKEVLDLDEGAGNRHTGKKIYTFLKRSGADKVYISDKIISTANHRPQFQHKIFETYFSYLLPELRTLSENTEKNRLDPNFEKYIEAYDWLRSKYKRIESLFCSQDFYFRAGYVAGYGVFRADPELE